MPSSLAGGPAKKAKLSSSANSNDARKGGAALAKVTALQSALAASSDLNPLSDLLSLARSQALIAHTSKGSNQAEAATATFRATQVLSRAFETLCTEDRVYVADAVVSGAANPADPEKVVRNWIRARWDELVELLCDMLGHELKDLRLSALRLLMTLQIAASTSLSRTSSASSASTSNVEAAPHTGGQWASTPWRPIMTALLCGPGTLSRETESTADAGTEVQQDVRETFVQDWMEKYDDVRFAFLREMSTMLRSPPLPGTRSDRMRSNALALLIPLTAIPTKQADLNAFFIPELSVAPSTKRKGAKDAGAGKKQKVTQDGDSDEGEEEEEVDMSQWFSDSEDEGGNSKNDKGSKAKPSEEKALGSAASGANKRRRRRAAPFAEGVHTLAAQRAAFSAAWLGLLLPRAKMPSSASSSSSSSSSKGKVGGELSLAQTHEVLVRLHAQILPHLVRPVMLHDFLVDCLDAGGATALLALNGLFTLIVSHNLDYPSFYTRLYSLLDAQVLHVRYRARFLRMLDTFLDSSHLPSSLVASFLKRLSRLSLRAPPAAIVSIVPFVYNRLKAHPPCLKMIHREVEGDRLAIGPAGTEDPYDPAEQDPLKTRAIESSLWELASLGASAAAQQAQGIDSHAGGETHYLGSASTLARILAEPFTKERYDLEDFLDLTYGTLFETETSRTLRRSDKKPPPVPALAYNPALSAASTLSATSNTSKAAKPAVFDAFPTDLASAPAAAAAAPAAAQAAAGGSNKRARPISDVADEEEEEDAEEREAREAMAEVEAAAGRAGGAGAAGARAKVPDVCARLWAF